MSDLLCWTILAAFNGNADDILAGRADTVEWTDLGSVVRVADGVEAVRGRASETVPVAAGTLRFRLNNDDGAFTPGRTDLLSDWVAATFDTVDDFVDAYPNALTDPDRFTLHGRPVRLRWTPDGGSPTTLWTGIVEAVESGWQGGTRGIVSVRAVDAAALLGQTDMRALPVATILAPGSALWCYPLDESAGPCLDVVGSAAPLQVRAVGTPGLVGAELEFGGSSPGSIPGQVEATVPVMSGGTTTSGWALDTNPRPEFDLPSLEPASLGSTVGLFVWPESVGRTRTALTVLGSGPSSLTIYVTATNALEAVLVDGATTLTLTGPTLPSGAWTHVAVTLADGTGSTVDATLWVDGVAEDVGNIAGLLTGLGRRQVIVGAGDLGATPWEGRLADVHAHTGTLSSTVLGWIAEASTSGEGELSTARAVRLLYAGRALAPVDVVGTAGLSTMSRQHTRGKTLAVALDEVAEAEVASWWPLPGGPVRMGSRQDFYGAGPALTLPAETVDSQTGFDVNTSDVVNAVTVARPGGATFTRRNDASVAQLRERGPGGTTALHVGSDAEAEAWADDVVTRHGWPTPSTDTLAVDVVTMGASVDPEGVLGVDIDQPVRVTGLPDTAPDDQLDFLVAGITDRIGVSGWVRTFNVGRQSMLDAAWILGTDDLNGTAVLGL